MKICGIIGEFNPFHNGHAYLLETAKRESGCDAVVCVMSGNFTQRGTAACQNKFIRAEHAVLAGADAVVELPAVFAVAPAEIFARGAVKLLSSLPAFSVLCFGAETPDPDLFRRAALVLTEESTAFRRILRGHLDAGMSLPKARTEALRETGEGACAELMTSPNNILGAEYARALLSFGSRAEILPVARQGAGHADETMRKHYSSASAIRAACAEGKLRQARKNVPPYCAADLSSLANGAAFETMAVYAALAAPAENIARAPDCAEGLENRIKTLAADTSSYDALVSGATGKRYPASRIRRILACNALGLTKDLAARAMKAPLYLNALAVRADRSDEIFRALGAGENRLLVGRGDAGALARCAKETYGRDLFCADVFNLLTPYRFDPAQTHFVKAF